MFSLPLIVPQIDQTAWLRSPHRPRSDSPPQNGNGQHPQSQRQQRQQRDEAKAINARSPLALLAADEENIRRRKAAIRQFGSHWIRPPGVPKTLQAQIEEAAELVEQEELYRQEQGMQDLRAQQQLEEARLRAAETAGDADAEDAPPERNLDDEIPEADGAADVTFNEESLLEGSQLEQQEQEHYAEMEEAELTGVAQDEEDLGIEHEERNLDDSIPEPGSYQHTDTDLSDSSSEIGSEEVSEASLQRAAEEEASQPRQSAVLERMRMEERQPEGLPRSPGSLHLSSSILGSSFVGSSPVMQRANQGTRRAHAARRANASRP